ncbi:response regulator [Candidatus Kaiserbacteria bacterium]|nr:response regulator [Candidatus Kaiserbacteria bacterium]
MAITKKILIVEDVPYLAESLKDLMDFKGYETFVSNSGLDGLAIALEKHPDLILLDIRLPDIDGFEVLRRIRHDAWGQKARILLLTAADVSEELPNDIDIDENDILHKSHWGVENLAARVEGELLD